MSNATTSLVNMDMAEAEKRVVVTIAHVGLHGGFPVGSLISILGKKGVVVVSEQVGQGEKLTVDYPYIPEPVAGAFPKKTAPWGKKQRFHKGY